MLRKTKIFMYIQHLFLMTRTNKVRIALTSIGIFIAIFVFSTGYILANTYYEKHLAAVKEMNENTIVLSLNSDINSVNTKLTNMFGLIPMQDVVLEEKYAIGSYKISKSEYLNILSNIHGVNCLEECIPIREYQKNIYLTNEIELLEGRLLTAMDSTKGNKVVVVDKITANILFPNQSAIGKTVVVGTGINGSGIYTGEDKKSLELEIVGVVESTYTGKENYLKVKKQLQQKRTNYFFYETSIYCPISVVKEYFSDDAKDNYLSFSFEDRKEFLEADKYVKNFVEVSSALGKEYHSYTKDSYLHNLETELSGVKQIVSLVTIILCIISGISIMSITFFSVKERVPEIGIRKAFGATKLDIVVQFIYEIVLISITTSIVAVCFSIIFCFVISSYLYNNMYVMYEINISIKEILLPVVIGIIEAVLCSMIPSWYGASIKVTDALKFE